MNTLSKSITAAWFIDASRYHNLRRVWRTLTNSNRKHVLGPLQHMLYLALLGKDWRRAFQPPTRPSKLASGALAAWPMPACLAQIRQNTIDDSDIALFEGAITRDDVKKLSQHMPDLSWQTRYDAGTWSGGVHTFDAYCPDGCANPDRRP